MDALSDVFAAVRLSGGVFLDAEFSAPWCVESQVGPEEFPQGDYNVMSRPSGGSNTMCCPIQTATPSSSWGLRT